MTALTMGGNAPLPGDDFEISVRWKLKNSAVDEIDVSAFVLTTSGKVASDDDMVFYGQRADKSGAVRMTDTSRAAPGGTNEASFEFDLRRLPAAAEKIAITGTINDAQPKRVSFTDVASLLVSVIRMGTSAVTFEVPVSGMTEAALILGELYKRNGQWKFRAVGQGYNGGLKPLAEGFGVRVDAEPPPRTAPSPVAPPRSAAPPTPPSTPPISLSKVTLTKAQPRISLAKKGASFGEIKVNLNWNKGSAKKGWFGGSGGGSAIDLDLACLFELKDGSIGAVQALGNQFGNFDRAPFVKLMADDRTGASADGEWLRINGSRWNDIRRIIIYTFIYDGVANWTQTDGIVTVYVPDNAPIEVKLDEGANDKRTCGIVLLENIGGEISVKREVQYFRSAEELDRQHSWGLRWTAGRK